MLKPADTHNNANPDPGTIVLNRFIIDVLPDHVLATVDFVHDKHLILETRQKRFPLDTPFITILEDVPNIFDTWSPAVYKHARFRGEVG